MDRMHTSPIGRREFLGGALAGGLSFLTGPALARTGNDARFVLVILRGALDGLALAPPVGDPDYVRLRRELALGSPGGRDGALPLTGIFGLHPSLAFLHECFAAGQLTVCHAVASVYRERSHFDGQDVLESGGIRPHQLSTGWLNRAIAAVPASGGSAGRGGVPGVALGQNLPLVMRGPASVTSWAPSRLAALDDDTLQRVTDLYAGDALLAQRLAEALQADVIATESRAMDGGDAAAQPGSGGIARLQPRAGGAAYLEVVRAAAGFLRREDGARVAVFDTNGWDTHANEGAEKGTLAQRLGAIDGALRVFRQALGPTWDRTALLAVTEFGRTAAVNGTRGTDHGTGAAALLVGGAVRGGRVVADWPGLSPGALYQGRDLAPTLDLRALAKGVLLEHLGVSHRALDTSVFPDSAAVRPLRDLIRT